MTVSNHERIALADRLYKDYGRPLEMTHRGEYVAISTSGLTVVAPTVLEVVEKASQELGPGVFVFKIGEKTVWR